ncbi:unnamed protein product [Coffea canephora]|uniref:DH200=94 genomic scaffold, scaffold_441 n=1 Tax=Coffea canephora TaxID=49390 RepID=A0A068VET5_COFCA|nr:unnamed protein product [Coffea canephora]
MNNNNPGSGFLSGYTGGFLGMNRNQQNPGGLLGMSRSHQQNLSSIPSLMNMKSVAEKDSRIGLREVKDSAPRGFAMTFARERVAGPRNVMSNGAVNINEISSDEDDPSMAEGNGRDTGGGKGKKDAPWVRMKWTDSIVRLLIQVVANVGEDGPSEGAEGARRKSGIIKKGKWRKVSKVLMSKGLCVSPQQCEDKFNDLNKRYKKLNDILGRGTSCRVVENPALLNNMEHLSDKAKEDVRKLLGSKHLFYKEMCAYHNGQKITDCNDFELPVHAASDGSPVAAQSSKDNDISEGNDADENDESDHYMSEDEAAYNNASGSVDRVETSENREMWKDYGNTRSRSEAGDDFQAEIAEMFSDPTKSQWERREWIRKRMLQLHEERIGIQAEAFELEKQRLKWQRFCNKKELELETARLEKERLIIENERKALQLKQKEVEVEFRRPESTFNLTSFSIDIMGGREQIDSGRQH